MIRATTPTHEFVFSENPSSFSRILITYSQDEKIVLEKEKSNLSFRQTETGEYVGSFRMTQAESNLFSPDPVQVQVRVLRTDGEALASNKTTLKVEDVLNDEVLT